VVGWDDSRNRQDKLIDGQSLPRRAQNYPPAPSSSCQQQSTAEPLPGTTVPRYSLWGLLSSPKTWQIAPVPARPQGPSRSLDRIARPRNPSYWQINNKSYSPPSICTSAPSAVTPRIPTVFYFIEVSFWRGSHLSETPSPGHVSGAVARRSAGCLPVLVLPRPGTVLYWEAVGMRLRLHHQLVSASTTIYGVHTGTPSRCVALLPS
jgi:hypothetical protein